MISPVLDSDVSVGCVVSVPANSTKMNTLDRCLQNAAYKNWYILLIPVEMEFDAYVNMPDAPADSGGRPC